MKRQKHMKYLKKKDESTEDQGGLKREERANLR